jgi:hypothetical protein
MRDNKAITSADVDVKESFAKKRPTISINPTNKNMHT